jgi:Zn-dependent M28 family amino/carboxypeptidase
MGDPRSAALAVAVSFLFITCFWPAAAPAAASDADLVASVDAGRMSQTISTLQDLGSREFHLESSREAAEFLLDSFEGLGAQAEHQHFMVGETQVSNVVATVPGTEEGGAMFLFGAHYDSENSAVHNLSAAENTSAPGADDDASGVAVVLELARVLSGAGLPWTLKFVMFGAEEYGYDGSGGCKGSEYFVQEEVAQGRTYAGTAIMDMVGYRAGEANRATLVLNSDHDDLASSVTDAVGAFGVDLSVEVREEPTITYSDHGSFWAQGIPSILVIEELDDRDFPVNPYYHTSDDTLDTLAMGQVEAVAQALLGGLLLMDEGGGPGTLLVFGTVIMSALIVSVALYVHFRRRRGRVAR